MPQLSPQTPDPLHAKRGHGGGVWAVIEQHVHRETDLMSGFEE